MDTGHTVRSFTQNLARLSDMVREMGELAAGIAESVVYSVEGATIEGEPKGDSRSG